MMMPSNPQPEDHARRMDADLWPLLEAWPYRPDVIPAARELIAANGHRMIQLRMDIGILQMEATGRPDGTMPHGHDSLLAYYTAEESRLPGETLPYKFNMEVCTQLQNEATQYFHRSLAYTELKNWPLVIADTSHVLDIIDMVSEYAEDDDVVWQFVQIFPNLFLQNTRARVTLCTNTGDYPAARGIIEHALTEMQNYFTTQFDPPPPDDPPPREIIALQEMMAELESNRPRSEEEALAEEIQQAVQSEDYEKAATLRDRLKFLRSTPRNKTKKQVRPESGGAAPSAM